MASTFFLVIFSLTLFLNSSLAITYDVKTYGAKSDGVTNSTEAFQAAWTAACASSSTATINVPKGRFLLGSAVVFNGWNCNNAITMTIQGTLWAPGDYNVLKSAGTWIMFYNIDGLSIVGGTIDGKGKPLWACKSKSGNSCPDGDTSMGFQNAKNVVVTGFTSKNSQMFHIVLNNCQNMKMNGMTIPASGTSPNTDGIHVQNSSGITILNSNIGTGDDCISIGPGARDIWIENITCGPGHGISIGSLGKFPDEQGVQNVTVSTSTLIGTQNGLRIKTWTRPSTGFAQNIVYQHVTMNDVRNPIIIDQNYCPSTVPCPGQVSGVKVSNVTYNDIHGTSATHIAVKFDCSPEYLCSGITLQDVALTYQNQKALASCSNATGSVFGSVQPSGCLD